MKISIICPYCNFTQAYDLDTAGALIETTILRCDLDGGGCDRELIVGGRLIPDVTIRKIQDAGNK